VCILRGKLNSLKLPKPNLVHSNENLSGESSSPIIHSGIIAGCFINLKAKTSFILNGTSNTDISMGMDIQYVPRFDTQ
jgi:hypothetical protein